MDSFSLDLNAIPALLLATSFVRFLVVLGLLRFGLGLRGVGFGLVTLIFAVALAIFTVEPKFLVEKRANQNAVFLSLPGERLDLMKASIEPQLLQKTKDLIPSNATDHAEERSVLLAYLTQEIRTALELGLLFLIPFILIDLLVVNGCLILGMQSGFATLVALPIKLFLFLSVDGWSLVIERLLRTVV